MKKLSLILILLPIFLITSMNFYGGETDIYHTEANRAFTCTSCHATIIGGDIIGGGKLDYEDGFANIEINIPVDVEYNGVTVNVGGSSIPIIQDVRPYISDNFGNLFNIDINSNTKGKKENIIKIKYPISAFDKENGHIEIQGVLSNLDGKPEGDYSFYKRLEFNEIPKVISVYPTIASEKISIDNLSINALIQVYNTNGQIVHSQISQSSKESVNVSEFQKGNYFISVLNGNNVSQSKFIVIK